MTEVDVLAANKGDAMKFIQAELGIPNREVLMAGDAENDIDMAETIQEGRSFIVVRNATGELKKYVRSLISTKPYLQSHVVFAKSNGLAGIVEGIQKLRTKTD